MNTVTTHSGLSHAMKGHNFRLWIVGSFISNIGGWMQATAQSWVVLTVFSSFEASTVGITLALQFGPTLLLAAPAGAIADRLNCRVVLTTTQSIQGVLALSLGVTLLSGAGSLWVIYLFAGLFGMVSALEGPTRQAFVNELVAKPDVTSAVALNAASFNSARLIGPAISGILLATIEPAWVFIINGFSYSAMIFAILLLHKNELFASTAVTVKGSTAEVIQYLRRQPDLILVLVITLLIGAFSMNFPIFTSTMALLFNKGASEFGILSSEMAAGSLAAALWVAKKNHASIGIIIFAALGVAASSLGMALSPNIEIYGLMCIGMGFSVVTLITTANGYIQTNTDSQIRGRILAVYLALLVGSTPIGAPLVGYVAQSIGPRQALALSCITALIAFTFGVIWWRSQWSKHPQNLGLMRFELPKSLSHSQVPTNPVPGECYCR